MTIKQWIEKYQQKRWIKAWLNSPQIKNTQIFLSKIYHDVNAHLVSLNERKTQGITDVAYTYGEIDFFSFAAALKVCEPQSGEVFYDIGAGAGKTVFASALLYDFAKTRGIESLAALYQLSLKQLDLFFKNIKQYKYFAKRNFDIEFYSQNLLDISFEEADIVFINATCYIDDFWLAINDKIDQLKVGARIILASKRLKGEQYVLIDAQMAVTSWGTNSVFIYKKIA